MAKIDLFKHYWGLDETDPLITDASTADNSLVEDLILRFQGVAKELTDKVAELSAGDSGSDTSLHDLKDAVILAYNALLSNDTKEAKKILGKFI